jgi:nucleoside-diphosphate-sugar epimerase
MYGLRSCLPTEADGNAVAANLSSSELVSINHLIDAIEQIAGIKVRRNYKLDAPLGVRGRDSDNTIIQIIYGWEPSTRLADGLKETYRWIYDQLTTQGRVRVVD